MIFCDVPAKWMLFLVALLMPVAAAAAQTTQPGSDNQSPAGRPAAMLQRVRAILDDLKLSDQQKAKVGDLMQQARQDLRDMMQIARDLAPAERREKLRNFILDVRQKIGEVLNDEQRATFQRKIEELREQVAGARGRTRADRGPGEGPAAGRGDPAEPGPLVRRLREALGKLSLSDEQKKEVDSLLSEMQAKAQVLRREAQADAQAAREKGRQLIEQTRGKLRDILSPDQQEKLRELMQRRNADDRARPPTSAPATAPTSQPSGKSSRNADTGGGSDRGGGGAMAPPMAPSSERLAIGQPAPGFRVSKLDGTAVQLESFQGKIALLAFGSYTSPSFRQRVLSLEDLRREYGSRVSFLIIYTREAHPSGQWEVDRNREQQIVIAQHADLNQRKDAAKLARTRLKLNIPLAVDSMEDDAARAFHAWPNDAAVLIDKDGTVLAYQQWFDAYGMKQAIQEALSGKPRQKPASEATTEP